MPVAVFASIAHAIVCPTVTHTVNYATPVQAGVGRRGRDAWPPYRLFTEPSHTTSPLPRPRQTVIAGLARVDGVSFHVARLAVENGNGRSIEEKLRGTDELNTKAIARNAEVAAAALGHPVKQCARVLRRCQYIRDVNEESW